MSALLPDQPRSGGLGPVEAAPPLKEPDHGAMQMLQSHRGVLCACMRVCASVCVLCIRVLNSPCSQRPRSWSYADATVAQRCVVCVHACVCARACVCVCLCVCV